MSRYAILCIDRQTDARRVVRVESRLSFWTTREAAQLVAARLRKLAIESLVDWRYEVVTDDVAANIFALTESP